MRYGPQFSQFQTPGGYGAYNNQSSGYQGYPSSQGVGGFPRPMAPTSYQPSTSSQYSNPMPGGFPAPFTLNSGAPTLPNPQFEDQSQSDPGQADPQTSAYGGAQNSTQRWQQQAGGMRQLSNAQRFSLITGRIDGRAPQSSRDTTPSGRAAYAAQNPGQVQANSFTPQTQWDGQFRGGQINIPKASKWAPY